MSNIFSHIASRPYDRLEGSTQAMSTSFIATTPVEDVIKSLIWYDDIPNKDQSYTLYATKIVIITVDYDVILRMYWLSTCYVVLDHQEKRIYYMPLKAKPFRIWGTSRGQIVQIISALQAKIVPDNRGVRFLISNDNTSKRQRLTPEDTMVVRDYVTILREIHYDPLFIKR